MQLKQSMRVIAKKESTFTHKKQTRDWDGDKDQHIYRKREKQSSRQSKTLQNSFEHRLFSSESFKYQIRMAFDCHVFHAYSNALVLWKLVRMFHVRLMNIPHPLWMRIIHYISFRLSLSLAPSMSHIRYLCVCVFLIFMLKQLQFSWMPCLFHYTSSSALYYFVRKYI